MPKSAYWHLNTNLLCDLLFQDYFKEFWIGFRSKKIILSIIATVVGLQKYKLDRYVSNTLLMSKGIEQVQLNDMQECTDASGDSNFIKSFKEKNNSLNNLLDLITQAALVRTRFQNIELMDAPSKFFFNLEKRGSYTIYILKLGFCYRTLLKSEIGQLIFIENYMRVS